MHTSKAICGILQMLEPSDQRVLKPAIYIFQINQPGGEGFSSMPVSLPSKETLYDLKVSYKKIPIAELPPRFTVFVIGVNVTFSNVSFPLWRKKASISARRNDRGG